MVFLGKKFMSLKRGSDTLKQPVFGIFEKQGYVYTDIVPDWSFTKRRLARVNEEDANSEIHLKKY